MDLPGTFIFSIEQMKNGMKIKPSVPGYWQHQGAGTAELKLNYSKLKSKIQEFLAELN